MSSEGNLCAELTDPTLVSFLNPDEHHGGCVLNDFERIWKKKESCPYFNLLAVLNFIVIVRWYALYLKKNLCWKQDILFKYKAEQEKKSFKMGVPGCFFQKTYPLYWIMLAKNARFHLLYSFVSSEFIASIQCLIVLIICLGMRLYEYRSKKLNKAWQGPEFKCM